MLLSVLVPTVGRQQAHADGTNARYAAIWPLMRGVMRIESKITIALLALLLSKHCFADGAPRPIDISDCMVKNCMSQDVHVSSPEENFRVQAWFDIVTFADKKVTYFYPLFNVFNYTQEPSQVVVGMQLLDQDKIVLLEAKGKSMFNPTRNTEGSYDTYFSVNAKPVTAEIVKNARYLRVVFERIM